VVIGSSTGGVDALERVLAPFPADCPPTLIAQHMPAPVSRQLRAASRRTARARSRACRDGQEIGPGRILLSGGGSHHLTVAPGSPPHTALVPAEPGDLYVPKVDKLFHSAARLRRRALGVILTGMGRDGAEGLLAMRTAGARTLGQTGQTCVIDGMPRAAREAGAVETEAPLDTLGAEILKLCSRTETVES
jgi:two-component system, chemotaxis family, protein-glutamate methylesterase/glutaminase